MIKVENELCGFSKSVNMDDSIHRHIIEIIKIKYRLNKQIKNPQIYYPVGASSGVQSLAFGI